jgi:hypothetical protein
MAIDSKTTVLPQSFLEKMPEEERRRLGRAGMTTQECDAKQVKEEERKMQAMIRQYLNLHEIEYINPAMNRRSQLPPGWPDFTFCYRGVAIGVECKVDGKKAEPHQVDRHQGMRRNGWRIVVAYGLADIQEFMRGIDAEANGGKVI